MSNPMLSKFSSARPQPVPVQSGNYGQYGAPRQAYGQPQMTQPYGQPQGYGPYGQPMMQQPMMQQPMPQAAPMAGRMTMDDVLTKTAICLGLVIAIAAATMALVPTDFMPPLAVGFSLITGIAALVISLQRVVSPAMAIGYAVLEGIGIGALSALFERMYPGIVMQAVLGTFVAAAVVLFATKTLNIRVGQKARQVFMYTTLAYAAAMLLNFLLSFAGINLGFVDSFGDFSPLGAIMCLVGTALAVFSLVTDFDDVRRGVEGGAPATESWRAAFGITFSMVWLYVQILRLLAYVREFAD